MGKGYMKKNVFCYSFFYNFIRKVRVLSEMNFLNIVKVNKNGLFFYVRS